jgi:hypothetical protein
MKTLIKAIYSLLVSLVSALDVLALGFEKKLLAFFTNVVKGALLAAGPLLTDVEA